MRIIRGESLKDCYNVEKLEFTEDDEMDQNVFNAKYHDQGNNTEEVKGDTNKEKFNKSEEEKIILKAIANEMLKLRQEEEEEIFRALLKEKMQKKMQKKTESNNSASKSE